MSDAAAVTSRSTEMQMDVAAQRLSFGAGLYLITLSEGQPRIVGGMAFPCVRIDPLPPVQEMPGRAFVTCLTEGQWLSTTNQSAFLQVEGGIASVVLTTYNLPGDTKPPKVRIRLVRNAAAAAELIAAGPEPATPELLPRGIADASLPMTLLVHCATVGDVTVSGGEWAGAADPRCVIEAFSIVPEPTENDVALEYQSIMGVDWSSPWVSSPDVSGSRGLALPLFGLRTRLVGAAADEYEVVMWARCGDREIGPITLGELDMGPDEPMSALKVALRKKARPTPVRTGPRRVRPTT